MLAPVPIAVESVADAEADDPIAIPPVTGAITGAVVPTGNVGVGIVEAGVGALVLALVPIAVALVPDAEDDCPKAIPVVGEDALPVGVTDCAYAA